MTEILVNHEARRAAMEALTEVAERALINFRAPRGTVDHMFVQPVPPSPDGVPSGRVEIVIMRRCRDCGRWFYWSHEAPIETKASYADLHRRLGTAAKALAAWLEADPLHRAETKPLV